MGLGWKNVDFGGMRSPPWAVASICATVTGRSSTPACASPLATARAHVVDAVLEAEVVRRGAPRGRRRAGWSRGHGRRRARRDAAAGAPRDRASTSVRHPASRMAAVTGPVGRVAARRPRTTARTPTTRSTSVGQAGDQPVDGVHGELVLDQLDEVARGWRRPHRRRRRPPRAPPCRRATSRSGGARRRPRPGARRPPPRSRRTRSGRRPARPCGARRPRRRRRRAAARRSGGGR